MRHTLYAYWVGQSVSWIVLTLVLWAALDKTVPVTASRSPRGCSRPRSRGQLALGLRRFAETATGRAGETRALIRYGAPRARQRCCRRRSSTDLAVLSAYLPAGDPELVGLAAVVRVAQALVLFLTAVSYMFSPFVADLHEQSAGASTSSTSR
ncbi:MAG: hypothetical protein U0V56_06310 [Actinomycetota bacterium]